MNKRVLFACVLMHAMGCSDDHSGDEQTEPNLDVAAIVGGREALPGNQPWIVALRAWGDVQCGGTLIDRRWVLTAAHCFVGEEALPRDEVTLVFGEHDGRRVEEVEQRRAIAQVYPHPGYREAAHPLFDPSNDDIALVELRSPVRISDAVQPIALATSFPTTQSFRVAGWGATATRPVAQYPSVLQQTEVVLLPASECTDFNLGPNEFCGGTWDLGAPRDSCSGDSGGPVIPADGSARRELVGVVSRGGRFCEGRGVYTRVDAYIPWIHDVTGL